jgi:hypothetical protein
LNAWHRYDAPLLPEFLERFEARWGKGTAPFLDPEIHELPVPRAQWVNADTGAALAVVPMWTVDERRRCFAVLYLPPVSGIWILRPGVTDYVESRNEEEIKLRNDSFKKAVEHARSFIHGTKP